MHCIFSSVFASLLANFSYGVSNLPVPPETSPPSIETVRQLLSEYQFKDAEQRPLLELGESAFPAYVEILKDPKSKVWHVTRTMLILSKMKTNRRQFIEPVVNHLQDSESEVRCSALLLLTQIGSEQDTPPIISLLSDSDSSVQHVAAIALAELGGRRTLAAMDVWLKSGTARHRDKKSLQHVKECRDKLEKRLKEASKDRK